MRKFIITVTAIALAGFIQAQDSLWTLEKCIEYALANNIQIKQQKLNTEVKKNQLVLSKAELLPNLNGASSLGLSVGHALDQSSYKFGDKNLSNSFGLSSSITLFSGLQQYNTILKDEFDLKASLQNLERIKNNISLNVASAYLNILYFVEFLNVSNKQLEITKLQIDRTSKLVEAGSIAKGTLLEIQAQAAAEELTVINAKNDLDYSYLILTQLLEIDSVEGFEIKIPTGLLENVGNQYIPEIKTVYSEAIETMPQIKGAEYGLKSAEKQLAIAKGALSPRLTLNNNLSTFYSDGAAKPIYNDQGQLVGNDSDYPFSTQLSDHQNFGLSVNLSIPIFNNLQTNNYIQNSIINIQNLELELENQKDILYKDIQQAYADAVAALNKYNATKKALVAMEESFRYTQEKFEVGLVNTVDYNSGKNQLSKTESDLLQSKYEFIFKTNILDFFRGLPLKL